MSVAFAPLTARPAAARTGDLTFQVNDPKLSTRDVALSAGVAACSLQTAPAALDFGTPPLGTIVTELVGLFNDGGASCNVTAIELAAGTDSDFSLRESPLASLSVASGGSATIPVSFEATASLAPFERTGALTFQTDDPLDSSTSIPLTAGVSRCQLTIAPGTLDFGNILLNGSVTDQVTLFNDGGITCQVSAIRLEPGTDPDFSFPSTQSDALNVPPGDQVQIAVTFDDLSGATAPFLREGTLGFLTGDPVNPQAQVPLEAYLNLQCSPASQAMYTVGRYGTFSRFDPASLTFTDIGYLNCETQSQPFSMAVDQNAVAWVVYDSGNIYEVSTADASCQATSFAINQDQIQTFGMSFLFQPTTGLDTLYVDSWGMNILATIAFPSLVLSPIAPIVEGGGLLGNGELAGTGDGELWDFVPGIPYDGGVEAILAQIDPTTAAIPKLQSYPQLGDTGDWATKFWGGSFWVFLGSSVYTVSRATGELTTVIPQSDHPWVVGVGVSTCAPVQAP